MKIAYPLKYVSLGLRLYLSLVLSLSLSLRLYTQAPPTPTSSELHARLEKLGTLGSALYLAAHPDDENTRMIAYLANVAKVNTAYQSLTRGDGGQNLIAPDIRELLGLTRTQELLVARRIDGGTQFFSRANDFGYSKTPDETFNIWDRDSVLADVVWVVRQWRPDVIILRFDPRAPGTTHGHHTASAILGMEAFELAGDPTAFPEQFDYGVEPWQAKRIYWNAYTWRGVPEHMDTSQVIEVDVNEYLPKLGESVAEIAARSRSQHKSQGFGSAGSRGPEVEQLELLAGDGMGEDGNMFAGINTSWSRVEGGEAIGVAIDRIIKQYSYEDPAATVPALLEVRRRIEALPHTEYWRAEKLAAIDELLPQLQGFYLTATTDMAYASPGDTVQVFVEATNRSKQPIGVHNFAYLTRQEFVDASREPTFYLLPGKPYRDTLRAVLNEDDLSSPYWLRRSGTLGMYTVPDQQRRGRAESSDPLSVGSIISFSDSEESITLTRPLRHRYVDPVAGEQFQPFEVLPPVMVEVSENSYLFTTTEPTEVRVRLTAAGNDIAGNVQLCTPEGWSVSPDSLPFSAERRGEEQFFTFLLTPPAGQARGMIVPMARLDGEDEAYTRKLVRIAHDHIPTQLADLDASTPVAKVDLRTAGERIGYLPGAGDDVPQALTGVGYDVTVLTEEELAQGNLDDFDAIVVGIRAYNVNKRLPVYQSRLLNYVQNGGTMIVQYNTTRGLAMPDSTIGPYPFHLSRDRVAVEEAPVRILAPDHPVLNEPNRITQADFEGWVQERGLYFANEWDERYTPILGSNDPGEDSHDGGLLVANYGDGYFVYTGYSFFRELPAGVPGAYRLFANLLALGSQSR